MDDRLERRTPRGVAEDEGAQPRPVQGLVGSKDLGSELGDDGGQPRRTRRDHLPRESVGVDHDGTQLLEERGDGALAGRHAACQSHPHLTNPTQGWKTPTQG
jgi:hypothetical protein